MRGKKEELEKLQQELGRLDPDKAEKKVERLNQKIAQIQQEIAELSKPYKGSPELEKRRPIEKKPGLPRKKLFEESGENFYLPCFFGEKTYAQQQKEEELEQELQLQMQEIDGYIQQVVSGDDYDGQVLDFLIGYYLSSQEDTAVFRITGNEPLVAVLQQFRGGEDSKAVIPLRINNNHYVGLFLRKDGQAIKAFYVDPTGRKTMPDNVANDVVNVLGVPANAIVQTTNMLQSYTTHKGKEFTGVSIDNHHCGPFMIHLLTGLAKEEVVINGGKLQYVSHTIVTAPNLDEKASDVFGKELRSKHLKTLNGEQEVNQLHLRDLSLEERPRLVHKAYTLKRSSSNMSSYTDLLDEMLDDQLDEALTVGMKDHYETLKIFDVDPDLGGLEKQLKVEKSKAQEVCKKEKAAAAEKSGVATPKKKVPKTLEERKRKYRHNHRDYEKKGVATPKKKVPKTLEERKRKYRHNHRDYEKKGVATPKKKVPKTLEERKRKYHHNHRDYEKKYAATPEIVRLKKEVAAKKKSPVKNLLTDQYRRLRMHLFRGKCLNSKVLNAQGELEERNSESVKSTVTSSPAGLPLQSDALQGSPDSKTPVVKEMTRKFLRDIKSGGSTSLFNAGKRYDKAVKDLMGLTGERGNTVVATSKFPYVASEYIAGNMGGAAGGGRAVPYGYRVDKKPVNRCLGNGYTISILLEDYQRLRDDNDLVDVNVDIGKGVKVNMMIEEVTFNTEIPERMMTGSLPMVLPRFDRKYDEMSADKKRQYKRVFNLDKKAYKHFQGKFRDKDTPIGEVVEHLILHHGDLLQNIAVAHDRREGYEGRFVVTQNPSYAGKAIKGDLEKLRSVLAGRDTRSKNKSTRSLYL